MTEEFRRAQEYVETWADTVGKNAPEKKRRNASPGVIENYGKALEYMAQHFMDPENWETPMKTKAVGA